MGRTVQQRWSTRIGQGRDGWRHFCTAWASALQAVAQAPHIPLPLRSPPRLVAVSLAIPLPSATVYRHLPTTYNPKARPHPRQTPRQPPPSPLPISTTTPRRLPTQPYQEPVPTLSTRMCPPLLDIVPQHMWMFPTLLDPTPQRMWMCPPLLRTIPQRKWMCPPLRDITHKPAVAHRLRQERSSAQRVQATQAWQFPPALTT
mmetsp:Transcript_3194/g.8457  ORF Transcript_3194/g.8457 Transcript_3194/m.8457 type:complete len:202 (-) Transcript_3194:631-1236(-)